MSLKTKNEKKQPLKKKNLKKPRKKLPDPIRGIRNLFRKKVRKKKSLKKLVYY
jgi:hypothetical protein